MGLKYPEDVERYTHLKFQAFEYSLPTIKEDIAEITKGGLKFSCSLYAPGSFVSDASANYSSEPVIQKQRYSGGAGSVALKVGADVIGNTIAFTNKQVSDSTLAKTAKAYSGVTLFPNEIVLFQGTNVESYTWSFNFVPKNAKEAKDISEIVDKFEQLALPRLTQASGVQMAMHFPPLWDVTLIKSNYGVSSTASAGSQWLKLKNLALKDVSIVLSPETTTFMDYVDSYPVATSMTLSFTEIRPSYR